MVWGFDAATQTYSAYFPATANVPGAYDLSSLTQGLGYWIALNDASSTVTWRWKQNRRTAEVARAAGDQYMAPEVPSISGLRVSVL